MSGAPLFGYDLFGNEVQQKNVSTLARRFTVPPFSVLNARDGLWQERKAAWISYGIQSELGRDGSLVFSGKPKFFDHYRVQEGTRTSTRAQGTSIFDPVLCELMYEWFCPPGGQILDPFAGGSVRGIVAALMGFRYWGCDLRAEQIAANREQARTICGGTGTTDAYLEGPTPIKLYVHNRHPVWLKRDDHFSIAGVRGGKARTCWRLAQGATGLVTAGSRMSPQVNIVAHIARRLGIPCVVHTPSGELTPELASAVACGAELIQHSPGYNSVICARAREDAAQRGYREIPFGMECMEAVEETAAQVLEIPPGVERIVVPVGSGMSLCGVLEGLVRANLDIPVLGVICGADPSARLDRYAPFGWQQMLTLERSELDYHDIPEETQLDGVLLDPVYEAKCLPYLRPGDLLWCVGVRETAVIENTPEAAPVWVCGDSLEEMARAPAADFLFTCPPYGDLEQYSEDPRDISTMSYGRFLAVYAEIIKLAAAHLQWDRFAAVVVGEFRDKKTGLYRNFVADTIRIFEAAGLRYYNEAILVTSAGTLPLRTTIQFRASRKLGKSHQNVLVFVKGDARCAATNCGSQEVVSEEETEE